MRFSLKSLLLFILLLCVCLGVEEHRISKIKSELEASNKTKEMWRSQSGYWQKNYYDYYFLYDDLRTKWNKTVALISPEQGILIENRN